MPSKRLCLGMLATLVLLKQVGARRALVERSLSRCVSVARTKLGMAPGGNARHIDADLAVRRVASMVGLPVDRVSSGSDDGALMALDLAMRAEDRLPRSLKELLGRLNTLVLRGHYESLAPWALDDLDVKTAYRRVKSFEVRAVDAEAAYQAVLRPPKSRPRPAYLGSIHPDCVGGRARPRVGLFFYPCNP